MKITDYINQMITEGKPLHGEVREWLIDLQLEKLEQQKQDTAK